MRSAIATVWRKEVLDNARDRRTVFMTLLFGPLFGPLLFAAIINFTVSQQLTSVEDRISVPIVGAEHARNLVAYLGSRGIDAASDNVYETFDLAAAAVRAGKEDVVLYFEETFGQELAGEDGAHVGLIFDQSNARTQSAVRRVRAAIQSYSQQLGSLRLFARGMPPNIVQTLIVDDFDVSTASGRSALLLGISTYFLLLVPLMGGLPLAIDTTAGERERKSLEPLFTTPVTRTSLMLGKLAATITSMIIALALTLVSFVIAIAYLPLEQIGMSSDFGLAKAALAFFVLIPFLPLGAALLLMVASFSKTHKEAQGYLSMMVLVPTMPLIFASIMNVRPAMPLMLVPSLSQHLLVSRLIRGESIELDMLIVASIWTLALGGLVTWIAVKLFKREAFLA
jgi:sodium transport system permease protein